MTDMTDQELDRLMRHVLMDGIGQEAEQTLSLIHIYVVMSGYYGFSNAGDDAILEAIQQAIHEASDHICVTALSNDPELTRRQYGLEAIPRFRVWKVFSALRRCDALLSGGGSLLQDTTSTRSLLYYLTVIRCAHRLGKPVMLYANGIGPVRRPANRRRVKRVVEMCIRDSPIIEKI